ncbi:hypothetical protein EIP86_007857 [Pleurotus ostreatoroseus]|nr:hypothetical protein EIP86_007857 [Pleurotus ostreatoroseus]
MPPRNKSPEEPPPAPPSVTADDTPSIDVLRRSTRQQKAAETRARRREEDEKSQLEDAERILARAGDRIGEWTASTRKRTVSETTTKVHANKQSTSNKRVKKDGDSKASRTKHLPRSLLNHNNGDDSDDTPLANAVKAPLSLKPVVKNARKPRRQKAPKPQDLSQDDLQDWTSDHERDQHGYFSSEGEEDDDSFKPSEDSDGGRIDRSLETPQWSNLHHSDDLKSRSSRTSRSHHVAPIDGDEDEDDALIPRIIDDSRSRRGSTASDVSMRTASSAGPPPTATTISDEEDNEELHRSNNPRNAYTNMPHSHHASDEKYLDDTEDIGNTSDTSFELPSKIGHLPVDPIAGIGSPNHVHVPPGEGTQESVERRSLLRGSLARRQRREDSQHRRQHSSEGSKKTSNTPSSSRHPDNEVDRRPARHDLKGEVSVKSRRQIAAEAERPHFKGVANNRHGDNSQHRDHSSDLHRTSRRREDSNLGTMPAAKGRPTAAEASAPSRNTTTQSRHTEGPHRSLRASVTWSADELQWPERTRVVYTGRNKINKREQSSLIQRLLDKLIEEFIIDFAFEKAIHKADERFLHQRNLLVEIADEIEAPEVADRVEDDRKYATSLINVAEGRLTSIRGAIKKTANALVQNEYKLNTGNTAARVAALLYSCQWIYPGDVLGKQDYSNPLNIGIFTQLLAAHFFDGPSSIAARCPDLFKSSLRDKPHEREIPEAMIALVCAVTALALSDWISGTYSAPRDFNIALAEKFYDDVTTEIQRMKTKSIKMYHRVMHQVYKNVCDLRAGAPLIPNGGGPSKLVITEE